MATSISYFEAWRAWCGGGQPPPDAVLWFMSLRWWARAGKIAAFLGGATVILDLIGPERLRQFGSDPTLPQKYVSKIAPMAVIFGWAVLALHSTLLDGWIGSVAFGSFVLVCWSLEFGPNLLARILDTKRPAQILRYISVGMLLIGFHFDLLAS